MQQVGMPSLQSAHSVARAFPSALYPTSSLHLVHHNIYACTSLQVWHPTSRTFYNKQYTLTTYYDDQKFWNMFQRARGVSIIWDVYTLGSKKYQVLLQWASSIGPTTLHLAAALRW